MSNPTNTTTTKAQSHLETLADGLSANTSPLLSSLVVLGTTLSKGEVISKLRGWLSLYVAVVQAKQAYVTAVVARKAAEVTLHAFVHSLEITLKQLLLPNNANMLASLGVAAPKPRKPVSAATRALANAKSKATREARGIKGKRQRGQITVGTQPQLQVVGMPAVSAADATPTAPAVVPASPNSSAPKQS
jgi:hypothetical protein